MAEQRPNSGGRIANGRQHSGGQTMTEWQPNNGGRTMPIGRTMVVEQRPSGGQIASEQRRLAEQWVDSGLTTAAWTRPDKPPYVINV